MLLRRRNIKLISFGVLLLTLLSIDYSLAWKNWNWLREHVLNYLFK